MRGSVRAELHVEELRKGEDGPDEDDGEKEEVGQRVREDRGGEGELGHEAVDELDHLVTGG